MITNLSQEQLVLLGKTVSARRMIDQARYTLGRVSIDPAMQWRLGAAFIAEVKSAVEALETALRERYAARALALAATAAQARLVEKSLEYRKGLVKEMASARLRGVLIPVQATQPGPFTENATVLAVDLERILAMVLPAAAALSEIGVTKAFLDEGKRTVTQLRESEERQELAKRTLQMAAVARKRELTAVVLVAVKTIVHASAAVHRGNPVAEAEYTVDLLRGFVHAPSEAPPPADSAPATGAA